MNLVDPKREDVPRADRGSSAALRELGDTRALVLAALALALFVYLIKFILLPFIVAGIVAYICTPLVDWLAVRTRLPRALVAALMFLLLIGCVALTVAFAGGRLAAEAGGAVTDLQSTLDRLLHQAGDQPLRLFGQPIDTAAIAERMRDWLGQPDLLVTLAGYGLAGLMGLFLTAALTCYFLVSGKSAAHGLFWLVPPRQRPLVADIGGRVDPLLKRYFLGVLAIVVYGTIAAYIGLGVVLHIDRAVLLAVMTGILETIPIIGTTAAPIIAGLVSLHTATGLASILAFALYAVLYRLSIDQVFAPLVLGGAAHLHPVLVIFCIFAGAVLFGIAGAILAVPTALTVKTALAVLYGDEQ